MRFLLLSIVVSFASFANDPSIAQEFPQEMADLRERIQEKFEEAAYLAKLDADDPQYLSLLSDVKALKKRKEALEESWRKSFVDESMSTDDSYALWDVGETTLSQLVMEYGASDYLYIIPQELSAMKLSLFTSIPIPRESWGEMIEMILAHNGVGVKKVNPFVKQLYILKLDPSAIEGIVSREEDLSLFDPHARLFFVFSPQAEQMRSVTSFFEKFSDPKQTTIQSVASKIVLVSSRETVAKLLGLYHAVWEKGRGKVVRLLNLTKISPIEAEKVLKAAFGEAPLQKARGPYTPTPGEDFSTLVLPQGLVLLGESEVVARGERILTDLEQQLEDPGEKVVYWYSCKNSNPEDIASVLERVYDSLIGAKLPGEAPSAPSPPPPEPPQGLLSPNPSNAYNPVLPVNPGFVQPGIDDTKPKTAFGNFVVDPKTASILMVVRREELPKIKSLLKKLDVPKRMVQIDVMLVEKKLKDQKNVGIDLLNVGSTVEKSIFDRELQKDINLSSNKTGIIFEDSKHGGIFEFIFRRPEQGIPIDLNFMFLMQQEDIRINANPSVLAINQTQATIAIVDEISINNGSIIPAESLSVVAEKSYTRAQYGTTIIMTPTVHLPDCEENRDVSGFVSLKTDVTFDTREQGDRDDHKPNVMRRHIVNEVQIADGETVILGGLRRKVEEDKRDKIPFLGDLPGIGKLFGSSRTSETSNEMFIFITPHIIRDPIEDLRRLRQEEYQKRPGDIPEFLARLDEAKMKERKRLFDNSFKVLFGN